MANINELERFFPNVANGIYKDLKNYDFSSQDIEGDFSNLTNFNYPGVYVLYDIDNNIIYAGNSYFATIKKRLEQYLRPKDSGNTLAKNIVKKLELFCSSYNAIHSNNYITDCNLAYTFFDKLAYNTAYNAAYTSAAKVYKRKAAKLTKHNKIIKNKRKNKANRVSRAATEAATIAAAKLMTNANINKVMSILKTADSTANNDNIVSITYSAYAIVVDYATTNAIASAKKKGVAPLVSPAIPVNVTRIGAIAIIRTFRIVAIMFDDLEHRLIKKFAPVYNIDGK